MTYTKKRKKQIKTKAIDDMTFKEFVIEMQKTNKLKAKVGNVRVKTGEKK
jgi:hypothetical protein